MAERTASIHLVDRQFEKLIESTRPPKSFFRKELDQDRLDQETTGRIQAIYEGAYRSAVGRHEVLSVL